MISGSNYLVGDKLSKEALASFISELKIDKDIVQGRNSGQRRMVYICKGCSMFQVIAATSFSCRDQFILNRLDLEHGSIQEDGLRIPCSGLPHVTARQMAHTEEFKALHNSQGPREGVISTNALQAQMGEHFKNGVIPSKNVVKESRKILRASESKKRELPSAGDLLVDISDLRVFLAAVQSLNTSFTYELATDGQVFRHVVVVMPYAKTVLDGYCYNVLAMDGAHIKNVEARDGLQQQKLTITSITTRSTNNKMALLAFVVAPTENAETMKAMIDFCAKQGIIFNDRRFTLFSDRGTAVLQIAREILPDTFKFLCSEHLKRNLREHGFRSVIEQFENAVHAKSAKALETSMTAIKDISIEAHEYLTNLPFDWNVMAAIRAHSLYDMTTNNIAEQVSVALYDYCSVLPVMNTMTAAE